MSLEDDVEAHDTTVNRRLTDQEIDEIPGPILRRIEELADEYQMRFSVSAAVVIAIADLHQNGLITYAP